MCNRYENEKPAWAWAELLQLPLRVTDEANAWEPIAYQAPNTQGLCLVQQDGEWVMRTANWSFVERYFDRKKQEWVQTDVFNARSDRMHAPLLPTAFKHEAGTSDRGYARTWQGSDLRYCWLPATAWLECSQTKKGKREAIWHRMHLEGEPFLLAGVCAERDGRFRMSMTMTQCPDEGLPAIRIGHDRMPLVFGVDAVGQADPKPIHGRVSSHVA